MRSLAPCVKRTTTPDGYLASAAALIEMDFAARLDAYQAAFVKGEADMAIGYLPTSYGGFHRRKLFDTPQICMLRADHPHIRDTITLEQYLAATHIVVEPAGRGPGVVEKALARARLQRKVAVRLPNIFAGPLIVRRTDHVMTVPAHTRFLQDELAGVVMLPLPLEVEVMDIELLWHERMHHDPGNQLLRGVIEALFSARLARAHEAQLPSSS